MHGASFTGFHLESLSRGGKSGDHRNKRGQQVKSGDHRNKRGQQVIKQCRIMCMCMYDIQCYLLKIATTLTCTEHEVHVYCRKDRSVQQGVVPEGDVPPPTRSAKLKVICVKTLNFRPLS